MGLDIERPEGRDAKKFNKLEIANYVSYIVILLFLKRQSIG